jgi:8-oxo-dGTP pyrophosphatase MutT (NUDIX family)
VEPGEDVLAAARREAREETGLEPADLALAATVHVDADPPVLLFAFLGELPEGSVRDGPEGRLEWHAQDALSDPELPFLDDVRDLLPRLLEAAAEGRVLHLATRPL